VSGRDDQTTKLLEFRAQVKSLRKVDKLRTDNVQHEVESSSFFSGRRPLV